MKSSQFIPVLVVNSIAYIVIEVIVHVGKCPTVTALVGILTAIIRLRLPF